jgi:hypothetical protein
MINNNSSQFNCFVLEYIVNYIKLVDQATTNYFCMLIQETNNLWLQHITHSNLHLKAFLKNDIMHFPSL